MLLYDVRDDPCRDSASGGQGTDELGRADVKARYCGQTKLYVAAQGYEPVVRSLDTCEVRAIDVALAKASVAVGGGAGAVANRFVEAVASGDTSALRELLLDAATAPMYQTGGLREQGRPYAIRMIATHPGPTTTVDLELLYDSGCRTVWRCLLKRDGASWRVAEIAKVAR